MCIGNVKVWDIRQRDTPVATFSPDPNGKVMDCWSVAFGNSYNDKDRYVCAGFENGDMKMFDLRHMKLVWETNLKNGN
ncbi:WD repeat-containing protein 92 [Coelomomyces lativittatus]|nr:WD repeat-containing protein 92 [Coelomomyces lativittatus]